MSVYIKSKEEMKPCPFCGSKDLFIKKADHQSEIDYIMCNDCNAEGPQNVFDPIKSWNERKL